jgi:hypothetical protein
VETEELAQGEAMDVVAGTARRLFPIVSEQLATLVLRDLAARGIHLVRDREGA